MPQYAGELKSGAYIITSCAANLPIARRSIEDKQVVEELYNQTVPKPVRVVTMAEDSSDLAVRQLPLNRIMPSNPYIPYNVIRYCLMA